MRTVVVVRERPRIGTIGRGWRQSAILSNLQAALETQACASQLRLSRRPSTAVSSVLCFLHTHPRVSFSSLCKMKEVYKSSLFYRSAYRRARRRP